MVRRAKFADGTPKPLPKPERNFQDKLKTLKNMSKGISPESRIRLLDYFIQEALTKGQLTEDQASGIYNQLQLDKDKIKGQIEDYETGNFNDPLSTERKDFSDGGIDFSGLSVPQLRLLYRRYTGVDGPSDSRQLIRELKRLIKGLDEDGIPFSEGGRVGFDKAGVVRKIRKGRVGGKYEGLFGVRAKNKSVADNIPGAVDFGPEAVYFKEEKDAKNFIKNYDKYMKIPIKKGATPKDDPARLKRIDDYVKKYEEDFGRKPSARNIRDNLNEQRRTIEVYEKEYGKLDKIKAADKITKVQRDIVEILKDPKIIQKLNDGKFPTITDVTRITKLDPVLAESRLVDVAEKLRDNPKYKKLADNYLDQPGVTNLDEGFGGRKGKRSRTILENRFVKLMGLDKKLPTLRTDILRKIQSFIPELKGLLAVDEIAGLTTSMRRGSGPYAIFGQVLGGDFNTDIKGHGIDKEKGNLEKKLTTKFLKGDPKRLIEQEKYNKAVTDFENEANKNNPAKKVRGLKLSFKPPSQTIKNKKVYKQYKPLFDAHYEKYGYSFEVPADRDSLIDISKKLDNKSFQNTIKNRFKKLIGKGGKVGAGIGLATLAGTGFALADDQGQTKEIVAGPFDYLKEDESFTDTEKLLAGTTAAATPLATKKGRKIYGALAKPLLRALSSVPAATYLAGKQLTSEDPNYAIAGADLLLPELGKKIPTSGTGIMSKIGRFALNPIGRLARGFTPAGVALQGVELVNQAMKEQKRIEDMRENDPEAYQQFIAEQEDMMRESAAYGGKMGKYND